jgi:hypothetical protein
VCVIGAGKMSKLLLTHLESHGVSKVQLHSHGRTRALQLSFDTHSSLLTLWPSTRSGAQKLAALSDSSPSLSTSRAGELFGRAYAQAIATQP